MDNKKFEWHLHNIVVSYIKSKYPDIKLNYASFSRYFEKKSQKYRELYEKSENDLENEIKRKIEEEIDIIMKERFFTFRK